MPATEVGSQSWLLSWRGSHGAYIVDGNLSNAIRPTSAKIEKSENSRESGVGGFEKKFLDNLATCDRGTCEVWSLVELF